MKFTTRGFRRRPDMGITYHAEDAPYSVYHSDQVGGVIVHEERWLAILRLAEGERLLGRHRSRAAAIRRCEKHERAVARVRRSEERREKLRLKKKREQRRRIRMAAH